jgi:hypothetical protein
MQGGRGSSRRWVAQQCPITRQATNGCPPAFGRLDFPFAIFFARDFVQFRISQKPLERGVFTLEVYEPLDVLPPDRIAASPA